MNKRLPYISFLKLVFVLSVLLLHGIDSFGQESESPEMVEHNKGKWRIAAGIGHCYIPTASTVEQNYLIIPTVGVDVQYWFGHHWGLGIKSDVEISDYVVEEGNGKEIERDAPVIISLPVFFRPFENELEFILGPGIELEEKENFSVLRLGVGYEFEFNESWDFSPECVYDLKNGNINSWTIAIGIGIKF